MIIAHCMKKTAWEAVKDNDYWGYDSLEKSGFVHCSSIKYLWRVLPNFEKYTEDYVIICMDEDLLESEVRYEDGGDLGRLYPHVYGPINNSAVTMVMDYLKDSEGHYRKNPELYDIKDE